MNDKFKILQYLGMITQLGISMITPPLMLVYFALFLEKRFGIGDWLTVVLLIVGIISSGCTFFNFFKKYLNNDSRGDDKNEKN